MILAPLSPELWTREHAAHLLNRAGFGGTPAEIDAVARLGLTAAVDHLLDWSGPDPLPAAPAWVVPGAEAREPLNQLPPAEREVRARELRRREADRLMAMRVWWLQRMVQTPWPLQEKLTLFWHGHFASGMRKVRSAYALYSQNATFRRLAASPWSDLVRAAVREPAMLIYLDNVQSRAKAPNENLARELMELFTLGEGAYSEADVQAVARALTGWSVARERYAFIDRPRLHDDGAKTLFGRTGAWSGDDVVGIIMEQPAGAAFIARKLWVFFGGADPAPELVEALGTAFREESLVLQPFLRRLFLSQAFYAPEVMHVQIKSPVQWLVGSLRLLERNLPPGPVMPRMMRQLGQDLFEPPNVKGWDGGTAWITASTLLLRYQLAATLVSAQRPWAEELPVDRILPGDRRDSRDEALQCLQERLFLTPLPSGVVAQMATPPEPRAWGARQVAEVLGLMMATPEYQLC